MRSKWFISPIESFDTQGLRNTQPFFPTQNSTGSSQLTLVASESILTIIAKKILIYIPEDVTIIYNFEI
jgi:hypothetical protein